MIKKVAVVGGGPVGYIPDLHEYNEQGMIWIGADQGAEVLCDQSLTPDVGVGDFDSVSKSSFLQIKKQARRVEVYPDEKDETDLELAIREALTFEPERILLFGVTGGRIDHFLANLQLLYPLKEKGIEATVIDEQNQVELFKPGTHTIEANGKYPYLSFVPVTLSVTGLTLQGFYYPLLDAEVPYGSTLCISNRLIEDHGTFSFESGILLLIRSKDKSHNS